MFFFFQAEDGIRDRSPSRGLGDVYKRQAKQLADRFGFQKVAITLRESISANDNNWSAMLYDGKDYYFSKKYAMHIVDRVGGGDSFGGGLIYACLSDMDAQSIIEFAVAASCLKHSIEGDMNMVSVDEVKKLAGGDGSGRVQRLSLIHISEPTRRTPISYAVFCLKKKKQKQIFPFLL